MRAVPGTSRSGARPERPAPAMRLPLGPRARLSVRSPPPAGAAARWRMPAPLPAVKQRTNPGGIQRQLRRSFLREPLEILRDAPAIGGRQLRRIDIGYLWLVFLPRHLVGGFNREVLQ